MVLADDKDAKIHCTVRKQLIHMFESKLREGQVYEMSGLFFFFSETTLHPYKLSFQRKTMILLSESSSIPQFGLSFTDIVEIFSHTHDYEFLVDVVGMMTGMSAEREYIRDELKLMVNLGRRLKQSLQSTICQTSPWMKMGMKVMIMEVGVQFLNKQVFKDVILFGYWCMAIFQLIEVDSGEASDNVDVVSDSQPLSFLEYIIVTPCVEVKKVVTNEVLPATIKRNLSMDHSMWLDCWLGNTPLGDQLPCLFSASSKKDGTVRDVSGVNGWELGWRCRLFVWEEDLITGLLERLPVVEFSNSDDGWRWVLDDVGLFSVKSAYLFLSNSFNPEPGFCDQHLRIFNNIWKSPAPSKVLAFSWKLLRNRIPTKVNLEYRGVQVSGGSLDFVLCQGREESTVHLFLFCPFASQVWNAIFHWLGFVIVIPPELFLLFDCLLGAASKRKLWTGFFLFGTLRCGRFVKREARLSSPMG